MATAGKFINALTLVDGVGGLASDYQLPTLNAGNAPVTISAKTVTLSASKNYDGNTDLSGAVTIGTGIGGEALSYSGASANDANVATAGKFINALTLADGTGGSASNYTLPVLNNANAPVTISPYAVSLSGSRIYDGSVTVDAGIFTIGTLVGSETLSLSGSGTVADQHVGNTKTVTLGTLALGDGTGLASNYTFTGGMQTADITAKTVTLSASKTYDSNTDLSGAVTIGTEIGRAHV